MSLLQQPPQKAVTIFNFRIINKMKIPDIGYNGNSLNYRLKVFQ